jgi:hypothetical protein
LTDGRAFLTSSIRRATHSLRQPRPASAPPLDAAETRKRREVEGHDEGVLICGVIEQPSRALRSELGIPVEDRMPVGCSRWIGWSAASEM